MKRLLIVAGSDSGGGAGVQADIKTATAYGVFAMTAITAVTIQNTRGVTGVHPVPDAAIGAQMRVTLEDIGADAVKTGMLHSAGVIETVTDALKTHAPATPLVVDPVMVAKGGARLVDDGAVEAMKRLLFPRAALVTPNAPEAEALLGGHPLRTADDLAAGGRELLKLGARAVLMKGGHLEGETLTDVLVTADGAEAFAAPRIETPHTHGTGCTMASAIASMLARGASAREAVISARAYVRAAMLAAPGLGHGHGPLNHMHAIAPWN